MYWEQGSCLVAGVPAVQEEEIGDSVDSSPTHQFNLDFSAGT